MKEDENKTLKDDIGISSDFVEGAAFDRELQQERGKARRDIVKKHLREEKWQKSSERKRRKNSELKSQSGTRHTNRDRPNVRDRKIKENFRRRG
mmetsp:Transcript_29130/g.35513  ORF Transcript_29130/g.35513 Transcript_29130/m.35513 type:complete len:94 (-) Transcript_29130:88-369(-)